jgi:zinc/manganese transport system substrate-binding protein
VRAMRRLGLFVFVLSGAVASADLRVVATIPNMGMLAREIGGDAVSVTVLAPPDRNAHYLEARPTMMVALRRADVVVAAGAELEVGWLPAAVRGANNRRVQPGQPGYFEAARQVELIGVGKTADRALGDVHPAGNPHVYMDPERMAQVGHALAELFGSLRPDRLDYFRSNAERFEAQVAGRMEGWRTRTAGAKGVVAYHADVDYLLHALEVPVLGYVEPLPGIPPTARHLRELVEGLAGRHGVVWTVDFQPAEGGRFIAEELGWRAVHLPSQVAMDGGAEEYFAMIEAWVATLEIAD